MKMAKIFMVMLAFVASQHLFASTCEERAEEAYQRALFECENGNPGRCRWDGDCEVGETCNDAGICVSLPTTCVLQCVSRNNDGRCLRYGQDFCGISPQCIAHCYSRNNDGRCLRYTKDYCADGGASCRMNCTSRANDGRCLRYGADICTGK